MVDNDMPMVWPVWTPGAPLAGFTDEEEYYTLLHTKKIFFMFFKL